MVSSIKTGQSRQVTWPTAAITMTVIVAVMWLLELVDQARNNALDLYGIEPRDSDSLLYIFSAPLLHNGYGHVAANSVPLLVMGFLVLLSGWARWLAATLASVIVSGAVVWLVAPANSITLGASGVVFGWLAYLLVRGFVSRNPTQIAIGIVVFLLYGGIIAGVLPGTDGVSWQGHLGGAIGGAGAAWLLHRRRSVVEAPW